AAARECLHTAELIQPAALLFRGMHPTPVINVRTPADGRILRKRSLSVCYKYRKSILCTIRYLLVKIQTENN
ncbi:hypothetical protein CEXT_645551, partial [Caerostris extrusa]